MVAAGMQVELRDACGKEIFSGETGPKGLIEQSTVFEAGGYEALFYVAAWYRREGVALPEVPFLDVVTFRFGIADPRQHYHLPFKCTPWGYSCFRGGA
jgi:5-hydroxyisourate hydrolase